MPASQARNKNAIFFGKGQTGQNATHLHIYGVAGWGEGELLWAAEFSTLPGALAENQGYVFDTLTLSFTQTAAAGESIAMAERSLRGRFNDGIYLSMATSALKAGELVSETTRQRLDEDSFEYRTV